MSLFRRSRVKEQGDENRPRESSTRRLLKRLGVHDEPEKPLQSPETNTVVAKAEQNLERKPDPDNKAAKQTPSVIHKTTTPAGSLDTPSKSVDHDKADTAKSGEGEDADLQASHNFKVSETAQTEVNRSYLWNRAYDSLKIKDQGLITEYETLLSTQHDSSKTSEVNRTNLVKQHDPTERRAQMEEIMKTGYERLEQRKLKYSFLGKEHVLEDEIASAVDVVLWAKDWIGEAIKHSPEASLVWAGVCTVLPLVTNVSTSSKQNTEGFEYVTSRMHWYVEFERLLLRAFEDSRTELLRPQFELLVQDLCQKILEYQIRSILRFYKARIRRLGRDALQLDVWKDMANAVKDSEAAVAKSAQQIREALGLEVTRDIRHDTTDIRNMMREQADFNMTKEHAECLQVFRLVDASKSDDKTQKEAGYEEYKNRIEERVEGTCQWFLGQENFKHWLKADSGILLVTADPGCGKSVLAKFLVDSELPRRMSEDQMPATICYFFFKAQIQSDISHAFCAILHQLLSQRPSLIKHALLAWRADGEKLRYISHKLWEILQNATADIEAARVVLVIDALDECEEYDRQTLVSYLEQYFGLHPASRGKLSVLCTGRPYSNVTSCFNELEQSHPGLRIPGEDETDKIADEINAVITYRVRKLERIRNVKKNSLKYMEQPLLQTRHRTYLWLHLLFHHLEDPKLKLTEKSFFKILTDVPPDFDKAYENILTKSTNKDSAMTVFKILLAAERAMTIGEMQIVFELTSTTASLSNLDLDDEGQFANRLRDYCGLLVTINNRRVYFLHQTAREFLIVKAGGDQPISSGLVFAHSISIEEAHLALARRCMVYTRMRDWKRYPDISAEWADGTIVKPSDVASLIVYVRQEWPRHIRLSRNCIDESQAEDILYLCQHNNLLPWFDAY